MMSKLARIPYEIGKRTVGKIRKMNVKTACGRAVNTASNVAVGAGVVSMIPLSVSSSTQQDMERINQYQPKR